MVDYPGEEVAQEGGGSLEGAFAEWGQALDERLSHLLDWPRRDNLWRVLEDERRG